jgi:hypothetical protein
MLIIQLPVHAAAVLSSLSPVFSAMQQHFNLASIGKHVFLAVHVLIFSVIAYDVAVSLLLLLPWQAELSELEARAAAGRQELTALRAEVRRLAGTEPLGARSAGCHSFVLLLSRAVSTSGGSRCSLMEAAAARCMPHADLLKYSDTVAA